MNSTPSRIRPVGGLDEEEAYVRIVAATHRDLPALVREGRFREDLWYRLSTAIVQLPPLRDRGSDLELLIDELWHSLTEHTRGVPAKTLSPAARRVLRSHAWPGNIRELMATLSRLRIQANDAEVSAADARAALAVMSPADHGISILDRPLREGDFGIQQVVDEVKRHYIRRALADAGGNKSRAARLLGLSNHSVLNDWMRALEIRRGRSS
jgi:DNA-binding NtrC family response regulator